MASSGAARCWVSAPRRCAPFKFPAFVELVDVAARCRRGDPQTLNRPFFDGNKAQLCQHTSSSLMSFVLRHEPFRYKIDLKAYI